MNESMIPWNTEYPSTLDLSINQRVNQSINQNLSTLFTNHLHTQMLHMQQQIEQQQQQTFT